MVCDGNGLAEKLLGLEGFRVLEVSETPDELTVTVESTTAIEGCGRCGTRAEAHDRRSVDIRDLACFGRPVRLRVLKRRWRCPETDCDAKTWTETHYALPSRQVMTLRAGLEAARQVGELARPVSRVAEEFGVCWDTVMTAVVAHGTPLVDDPDRVRTVNQLGVDETSFLKANRRHRTVYATGLVDTDAGILIDMVKGNSASDLRGWCRQQQAGWLAGIGTVSIDLTDSYRSGLSPHLDHALRVADPFHVVRVANRCLDKVRRRVQQDTLGHRGRKHDPLYQIRKLLLIGNERLDDKGQNRMLLGLRVGDPYDEIAGAWLAKESVRDVYLVDDPADAAVLLDKAIVACLDDDVPEIRALGRTLGRWRTEILNHHLTGASNGPTEALNLVIKKVKRAGHGFRRFDHYRLRCLLHAGGVTWPNRPSPPRIRTRQSPLR
ncbi:ISL3-like element ISAar39 family transposase [soil metagenome]